MILLDSVEQEHFNNAMKTILPASRNLARKSYRKARDSGQTHASAMTTMRNMFTENTLEQKQLELILKCSGIDENLHQSSQEGDIASGTNKNLGPVKKMMGNKTTVSSYLKYISKSANKEK